MDPIPSSSAHAPAPSNGQVNGAPIYKRKSKPADPLFGPKRKIQHRPLSNPRTNGQVPPRLQPLPVPSPSSQRSLSPGKSASIPEERIGGFSDPALAPGSFRDYRLVTTKKHLLEGLRFHLLQFSGDKPVDIRDEHEFVRPVRLHRRDPRAAATNQAKAAVDDPKDGLDAAEREELSKRKEQRQKEREENLKQIAPSTSGAKKGLAFKKKTAQVWSPDYSPADRKRIQTNYEEKLPWHLEDFENKHCFVGAHQSGSTNAHAAFVYEADPHTGQGRLRLLPVEKVYHFKPKQDKVKVLTLEEAEKAMRKHSKLPEALERAMRERQEEFLRDREARRVHGVSTGIQRETLAGRQGEEADFDFYEDFADDEEGDLFKDKDEDAKIAEKRIKEDQLKANLFNRNEEKEYDLE
jgi:transcription initiation factor TFIIF subunit alpha